MPSDLEAFAKKASQEGYATLVAHSQAESSVVFLERTVNGIDLTANVAPDDIDPGFALSVSLVRHLCGRLQIPPDVFGLHLG